MTGEHPLVFIAHTADLVDEESEFDVIALSTIAMVKSREDGARKLQNYISTL